MLDRLRAWEKRRAIEEGALNAGRVLRNIGISASDASISLSRAMAALREAPGREG